MGEETNSTTTARSLNRRRFLWCPMVVVEFSSLELKSRRTLESVLRLGSPSTTAPFQLFFSSKECGIRTFQTMNFMRTCTCLGKIFLLPAPEGKMTLLLRATKKRPPPPHVCAKCSPPSNIDHDTGLLVLDCEPETACDRAEPLRALRIEGCVVSNSKAPGRSVK